MRVIAGTLKGRQLKPPTWEGLRPTSDKLRETLFNVVAARVAGARVLDGFAGTGALGIEALSRGAAGVTFVERAPRAQALIAENLVHCGIADSADIIRAPMARALAMLRASPGAVPFDLVLLDPPYDSAATARSETPSAGGRRRQVSLPLASNADLDVSALLADVAAIVAPDGLIVFEHGRRNPAPASAGPLACVRRLESGDSVLSFYAMIPG